MKNKFILASVVFVMAVSFVAVWSPRSAYAVLPGVNGKIAFQTDRDGNTEIYTMYTDGSNTVNLTNNSATDSNPVWSPDGMKLAFSSNRDGNNEIYIMNADGSSVTRITNDVASDLNPSWSPDGAKIAFQSDRSGNDEVYTINVDGTNPINVSNFAANSDRNPQYAGDSRIVYRKRDSSANIFIMNGDGTSQAVVSNYVGAGGDDENTPNVSPDGVTAIFTLTATFPSLQIYTAPTDGSSSTTPTRISTNGSAAHAFPTYSPDGTKILYASNQDGDNEIYRMDVDGTGVEQLTNNVANDTQPAVQPLLIPKANDDPGITTVAGNAVVINVLSNDTDTYGSVNPASVTVTAFPANGTTSVNTTTGAITYTPNASFVGSDSFMYQVCSSESATLCDTATVSITVSPVIPGLPKAGDNPGSTSLLWILAPTAIIAGLTIFGIKRRSLHR